jgi:hypothetical protein
MKDQMHFNMKKFKLNDLLKKIEFIFSDIAKTKNV